MESIIITISVCLGVTILITPVFKKFLEEIGIVETDVQKKNKPVMAGSAGLPLATGLIMGILSYVFITTFITKAGTNLTILFASLTSVLIITLLALLDDINIKPTAVKTDKGEKSTRIGLKQWQKAVIPLIAAIPLMVISAGYSTVSTPFGTLNLGILYPLIIVPLVIGFTSNAVNMLAGMNGLETGMGMILLTSTGLYSIFYGTIEGGLLAISMASCLMGLLYYNAYPAKILPGDTLTYLIGAVFGVSVIIGNIEKFALIAFTPWIIEFLLKARGRFKVSSLGLLQRDGTLKPKYDKTYSLTHIAMRLVKREEYIAPLLMFIESIFCITAFIIARVTV